MAETPKVYVICDQNCKFEGMTKEQILTAITQAVENGTIGDVDTGFVQTVKTINGIGLKFFVGTQAQYMELTEEDKANLYAIITDDTTLAGLQKFIDAIMDGSFVIQRAETASGAPSYVNEEVKTFTFGNKNGFGLNDAYAQGFFMLWSIPTENDGNYYCCLVPTLKGKQNLGYSELPFNTVYTDRLQLTMDEGWVERNIGSNYVALPEKGLYLVDVKVQTTEVTFKASTVVYFAGAETVSMLNTDFPYPRRTDFRIDLFRLCIEGDGKAMVQRASGFHGNDGNAEFSEYNTLAASELYIRAKRIG